MINKIFDKVKVFTRVSAIDCTCRCKCSKPDWYGMGYFDGYVYSSLWKK